MLSRAPSVFRRPGTSGINDANFVIPWKLVQRVNSALNEFAKQRDKEEDYEVVDGDPDDDVAAAYVVSEMGGFSVKYVRLLLNSYSVLDVIDEYCKDIDWIVGDWSKCGALKHEFLETVTASPDVLASEVAQLYRQPTISRELHIPSGSAGRCLKSTFGEIVGRLARHKMLNGVVMDAALWQVSKHSSNYFSIDVVSVTDNIVIPDYPLSTCKFVLVPVYMKAFKHWMIQIVEIQMGEADASKHKVWVTLFDPLGAESNLEICEAKWISFTIPLLQQWHNRDMDREKL